MVTPPRVLNAAGQRCRSLARCNILHDTLGAESHHAFTQPTPRQSLAHEQHCLHPSHNRQAAEARPQQPKNSDSNRRTEKQERQQATRQATTSAPLNPAKYKAPKIIKNRWPLGTKGVKEGIILRNPYTIPRTNAVMVPPPTPQILFCTLHEDFPGQRICVTRSSNAFKT